MHAALQSAHEAYRHAADLAPPAPPPADQGLVDAEWRFVDREVEVQWGDVIAFGGAVFFLFAGALLGDWLHVPL